MNEDEFAELLESGAPPPGASRQGEDIRALLADECVWVEPDPAGADALLRAIRRASDPSWDTADDDLAVPLRDVRSSRPDVGTAAGERAAEGRARGARRRIRSRARAPLLAAAALALVAGVLGALVRFGGEEHRGHEFALAGTRLSTGASAWGTVDEQSAGVSIKLDVRGLAPAKPGTYYEAWVEGADGRVSVGTFHMRGGDGWIYLWSGVEPSEYPTLNVTLEQEGPDQGWSGEVVLRGSIA